MSMPKFYSGNNHEAQLEKGKVRTSYCPLEQDQPINSNTELFLHVQRTELKDKYLDDLKNTSQTEGFHIFAFGGCKKTLNWLLDRINIAQALTRLDLAFHNDIRLGSYITVLLSQCSGPADQWNHVNKEAGIIAKALKLHQEAFEALHHVRNSPQESANGVANYVDRTLDLLHLCPMNAFVSGEKAGSLVEANLRKRALAELEMLKGKHSQRFSEYSNPLRGLIDSDQMTGLNFYHDARDVLTIAFQVMHINRLLKTAMGSWEFCAEKQRQSDQYFSMLCYVLKSEYENKGIRGCSDSYNKYPDLVKAATLLIDKLESSTKGLSRAITFMDVGPILSKTLSADQDRIFGNKSRPVFSPPVIH